MGNSPCKHGGASLGAASATLCQGLIIWHISHILTFSNVSGISPHPPFLAKMMTFKSRSREETAPLLQVPNLLPKPWVSLKSHFGFLLEHPGSPSCMNQQAWAAGSGGGGCRAPSFPSLLGCPPQKVSTSYNLPYPVCEQLPPCPL